MTDVIERLRAANPVPACPPPPIEDVWRRLDADPRPSTRLRSACSPTRVSIATRLPSIGGVTAAISTVMSIAVAAVAITLLGHSATRLKTPSESRTSPLASPQTQAGRRLGSATQLDAALRTLHGVPIVDTAWASWCEPCRRELPLFAPASARYGQRVTFLGIDTGDVRSAADSFLAQHPISFPSYQATIAQLRSFLPGGVEGLPTTIFIDSAGKVVDVHAGSYVSSATIDQDVARFASSAAATTGLSGGDPASDVLEYQDMFMAADAGGTLVQTQHLQDVIAAAGRAGYPVRVAVIASEADLGAVRALWRRPRIYARFLGLELSLVNHEAVLVVMPNGVGLYQPGSSLAADTALLARISISSKSRSPASRAAEAVTSLAAASGHPITAN
jgi:thiol-disulfide isomerase/thioredoxin